MKRPLLLVISICIVLAVFLFYKGIKSSTADLSDKPKSNKSLSAVELITEESFFENSLKALSPELAEKLRTINTDIGSGRNNSQKIDLINKAGSLCDSAKQLGLTGYYAEKMALIKQSTSGWIYVANRYANAVQFAKSEAERTFLINKGKETARNALSSDPGNLDAQNILAQCIIDQSDDSIMTVIPLLKSVESKDSNNIAAIYNLAMLSVKSGQTDKAIPRFNHLIRLEPMNAENYYRLAELLSEKGEKKEALKMLETCKSLVESKDQIKMIDEKIKEITNK